jgi:hypothetical protein
VVREWHDKHPEQAVADQLVLTQPWPATSSEKARGIPDRVVHYQFRHDRARRTLRGIDEQIAKAERAVDGHAPVKRQGQRREITGARRVARASIPGKLRLVDRREARWRGGEHARGRRGCIRHGRRCRCRDRLPGGQRHYRTCDLFGLGGTDVAEDPTKRSHGDYGADTDSRRPQLPLLCLHLDDSNPWVVHRGDGRTLNSAESQSRDPLMYG